MVQEQSLKSAGLQATGYLDGAAGGTAVTGREESWWATPDNCDHQCLLPKPDLQQFPVILAATSGLVNIFPLHILQVPLKFFHCVPERVCLHLDASAIYLSTVDHPERGEIPMDTVSLTFLLVSMRFFYWQHQQIGPSDFLQEVCYMQVYISMLRGVGKDRVFLCHRIPQSTLCFQI